MDERRTLTIVEAARWLGIGKTLAYELIQQGRFPVRVIELGARRLVVRADLERFLAGEGALASQAGGAASAETAAR